MAQMTKRSIFWYKYFTRDYKGENWYKREVLGVRGGRGEAIDLIQSLNIPVQSFYHSREIESESERYRVRVKDRE